MPERLINANPAEIGERIRLYREEHGLSQKQMAEQSGVTASQLCRYEKGLKAPGSTALARLGSADRPVPVVQNTRAKYLDAYRRLTGRELVLASA